MGPGRRKFALGLARFLMGSGLFLCATSVTMAIRLQNGAAPIPTSLWTGGTAAAILSLISCLLWRTGSGWTQQHRIHRACKRISPLAEAEIPQLLGDYSPYIIEAAAKLGEARDTTAVPALLGVLEIWVNAQRPGWGDVAEALIQALERIGDRRALPLLNRLLNVRGIGILPAIRSAIAAIEPQTSLLRPGCSESAAPEWLLRPIKDDFAESNPALLLRAVRSTEDPA
jgi:hypothetical protein